MKDYMKRFPTPDNSFMGKDKFDQLIELGWLEQKDPKSSKPGAVKLTEKAEALFVKTGTALEDLLRVYPSHTKGKNQSFPLHSISNYVFVEDSYLGAIGESANMHKSILRLIELGVQHGYVFNKLESFIEGRGWLALQGYLTKEKKQALQQPQNKPAGRRQM